MFGAVGAYKAGPERVGEVAPEIRVGGTDQVEGVANPIGHRFAHAFGRIASRARTATEPVCALELFRDRFDFMPRARRLP